MTTDKCYKCGKKAEHYICLTEHINRPMCDNCVEELVKSLDDDETEEFTCGDCIAGELYDQPIEPGCIGCKYSLRRKGMRTMNNSVSQNNHNESCVSQNAGNETQDLLKEARELCEAATPGPWEICPAMGFSEAVMVDGKFLLSVNSLDSEKLNMEQRAADARFIARARTLVPELADFLEAVVKTSDDIGQQLHEMMLRAEEAERKVAILEPIIQRLPGWCECSCDYCVHDRADCSEHGCFGWQFDYERFKEGEHEQDN